MTESSHERPSSSKLIMKIYQFRGIITYLLGHSQKILTSNIGIQKIKKIRDGVFEYVNILKYWQNFEVDFLKPHR